MSESDRRIIISHTLSGTNVPYRLRIDGIYRYRVFKARCSSVVITPEEPTFGLLD